MMKSIRTRLVVGVFTLIVFIFAVFFLLMRNIQLHAFERTERLTDMTVESFLISRWDEQIGSLAKMYAEQLVRPVYAKDLQAVGDLAGVVREQGNVNSVMVLDHNGIILSDGTSESLLLGKLYKSEFLDISEDSRVITVPIGIGAKNLGSLVLSFDVSETDAAVKMIHAKMASLFRRHLQESEYKLLGLFLCALIAGLLAAIYLSRSMSRPLHILSEAIERIGHHRYDIALPKERDDEIGDLSRALHRMATTLRSSTVSKKYLEQILASMPVGVAITDRAGRIADANPRFYELCRRSSPRDSIAACLDIDHEVFADVAGKLADNILLEGMDISVSRQRDGQRHALLSGVPITAKEDGQPLQFLFVIHDITERKGLEKKLRHLATHDHLTGLSNRRYILKIIENELRAFRRQERGHFWLVFIDLDSFKQINDTHGHQVGDRVLQATSRRLENISRDGDVVGRLSGDEFLVLLRSPLSEEQARQVAERMLNSIRAPISVEKCDVALSASIGLARSKHRHNSTGDIINESDTAMYKAKMRGKNRVVVFEGLER